MFRAVDACVLAQLDFKMTHSLRRSCRSCSFLPLQPPLWLKYANLILRFIIGVVSDNTFRTYWWISQLLLLAALTHTHTFFVTLVTSPIYTCSNRQAVIPAEPRRAAVRLTWKRVCQTSSVSLQGSQLHNPSCMLNQIQETGPTFCHLLCD